MKIAFGITGGISIYKIPSLIRMLVNDGHEVKVVMTGNAARLVNPLVFKVVSGNDVYMRDFSRNYPLAHIDLGNWCDEFVIAPLTANTLSKIVSGIADNLLTSAFIACDKRKILFPSMNVKMYESKVTQENIRRAKSYGWTVVEPDTGELACGYSGKGRLPSVEKIFGIITRNVNEPLKGKKFIVTAGSSIERIDPVRYISNFSSGKMGVEIAKYLYRMGADVLLVCGRVSVNLPEYIDTISVESTSEMLDVLEKKLKDFDGLYMAAAPVDFMPEEISKSKIKKADKLNIGLIKTPDILGRLKILYPDKFYVGFALETDDPFENAVSKLKNKGLDFIALNVVTDDFNPMGSDENSVTIISKDGIRKEIVKQKKDVVAAWIVNNTLGLCEK